MYLCNTVLYLEKNFQLGIELILINLIKLKENRECHKLSVNLCVLRISNRIRTLE